MLNLMLEDIAARINLTQIERVLPQEQYIAAFTAQYTLKIKFICWRRLHRGVLPLRRTASYNENPNVVGLSPPVLDWKDDTIASCSELTE